MEYFTRMQSNTGVNMVIISEDIEPNKQQEILINYLIDIDENQNAGTIGENVFVGNINEINEVFDIIADIMYLFKFKYMDIWFDGNDVPPRRFHLKGV